MESKSVSFWDLIAQEWAEFTETNDYRNYFLIPETLRLLGEVKGKRILDLGCGEGGYSRILASKGAIVTAIDASPRLIEIAKSKGKKKNPSITYLVKDAASLDGISDGSFDVILAAMSLMDVEDYNNSVAEVWHVLRKGGILLMSILHPCFASRKSKWERDKEGNFLYLRVDNYFDKTPWKEFIHPKKFKHEVIFRHMPLQDFINPLIALGFKLLRFHEPIPTPAQMQKSPRLLNLARVPMFLFMEWQKG